MDPVLLPVLPEQKERPPHVEFTLISVEDREATMKAGAKIMKDQEFALIYPRGGKDKVKKKVPEPPKEGMGRNIAYEEFMARFGPQYQAWKKGQNIPVEGTALKLFPLLTPAQIENCHTFHIFTVEQLAEANEETLTNMGMGSRGLKMTAQRWLDFGETGGKQVTHIEDLEAQNQGLKDRNEQLETEVKELQAKIVEQETPPRKRPGRPLNKGK